VGKTSLKKIIFENSKPSTLIQDSLEPTRGIETTEYTWLDVKLSIFDTSGQEIQNLFKEGENQLNAFEKADLIIYMFDYTILMKNSQEIIEEIQKIYKIMKKINNKAKLILIYHKIDLIPKLLQNNLRILTNQVQFLINLPIKPNIYFTSIKEDFIYSVHNTFSELLSSFSSNTHSIKKILDDSIQNESNVLCLITDDQNKVITQSKTQSFNINLIYDSFIIFYNLWEQNKLEEYSDMESHLFNSNDKIFVVKIAKLKFLKSNLQYLIGISDNFNEINLDKVIHRIKSNLISYFK